MKKRMIAPLTALTIGCYSIMNALFYAADSWMKAAQVMFGLAIVIVGLCILDDALNTIREEKRREALLKELEDKSTPEQSRKFAEQVVKRIERGMNA